MTIGSNRSTVVIDNAVHRDAKLAAARHGMSLSRYIALAIADYMVRNGDARTVTPASRTITPKPEVGL